MLYSQGGNADTVLDRVSGVVRNRKKREKRGGSWEEERKRRKGEVVVVKKEEVDDSFYRTRVRSLATLVSNSLTHSLTLSLLSTRLD